MLQADFPRFTRLQNVVSRGSVYSRDRMLRLAKSDIVVSLDDDSFPVAADFLKKLGLVFEQHPEAAVVAFPELRNSGGFAAPDRTTASPGRYVCAYANCAAAMRREFYFATPGFCEFFKHMYEEPDYALQCYAAGAAVWFDPGLAVAHRESTRERHLLRRHQLNARNELWSVWLRCPWPWLPLVSAYRMLRQLCGAWSSGPGWTMREPLWWFAAIKGISNCCNKRQAIPWAVYYRWMRLARCPVFSAEDVKGLSHTSLGR
jgi:hypothetical protein